MSPQPRVRAYLLNFLDPTSLRAALTTSLSTPGHEN